MEFKVGDRVKLINSRVYGTIINKKTFFGTNEYYKVLFDGDKEGFHIEETDLELVDENNKTQEQQKIEELERRIEKLEKCVMGEQNKCEKCANVSSMSKNGLLTEDERVILRNLDKKWKWIARDEDRDDLHVYSLEPVKTVYEWNVEGVMNFENFYIFNHLFQFIKWTDKEPYNIEELLKGECEE